MSKPHFVFRPGQAVIRLREITSPQAGRERQVVLPWGAKIDCLSGERVGSSLCRTGIYDLPVSEALARLVDPGDCVIDAGANIGYMSSLAAWRAGDRGRVLSFEPNPAVLPALQRNVARWGNQTGIAPVTVHPVALSDENGRATLCATADFATNMGTASLSEHSPEDTAQSWQVESRRLDDYIRLDRIGMLKLDVEDHELNVMRGAQKAIAERRVRDILLEDRTQGPSPKLEFLRRAGYHILAIDQGFLGLRVTDSRPSTAERIAYDPPTFLATCDVPRARGRLSGLGWTVLNPRLFPRRIG
jgi:FkbM family methyltransferase